MPNNKPQYRKIYEALKEDDGFDTDEDMKGVYKSDIISEDSSSSHNSISDEDSDDSDHYD